MRSVWFKDGGISFREGPEPALGGGEVLIRPLVAGICNTDIELLLGYHQFEGVAGHEFVGVVEKSPDAPQLVGRRVVCEINRGCGQCSWCQAGNQRHCPSRKVIGIKAWAGAFAEYVKAPLANVHLVDESIGDEQAVFVEPLAAALQISQQVHITNSTRTVVLGDGKLGLLIALALRHYNPGLLLVGRHENKLAIAREQGVRTLQVGPLDPLAGLGKRLGSFDLVIEATGKREGIDHALDLVRAAGTIVLKTTTHDRVDMQLARVVVDEITVVGSRCGDFGLALAFLKNKWVDVLPLVEAVYKLEEFKAAFDHARRPGAKKVLVRF